MSLLNKAKSQPRKKKKNRFKWKNIFDIGKKLDIFFMADHLLTIWWYWKRKKTDRDNVDDENDAQ